MWTLGDTRNTNTGQISFLNSFISTETGSRYQGRLQTKSHCPAQLKSENIFSKKLFVNIWEKVTVNDNNNGIQVVDTLVPIGLLMCIVCPHPPHPPPT